MSKEEITEKIEDIVDASAFESFGGYSPSVAEREAEKLAEKLALEKSELIGSFMDYVKEEAGIEIPEELFIKFLE